MTRQTLKAFTFALLLPSMLLAGCGANPAGTKKVKKKAAPVSYLQQQVPGVGAPQVGVPGQMAPEVAAMLNNLNRARQSIPGFTCTVETYDKGPTGLGTDIMKVAFKKPSTFRIELTKAEGQAQGAKILWRGGSDLEIKPAFLPMTVTKSLTDAMVKSKNGWTIRETEVNAMYKVLFDPGTQIHLEGTAPINNIPMQMFRLVSQVSPKGTTSEVIGINPQTGLPGVRMMFKGETMIYRLLIKNMVVKSPSASEMSL